jgi:hypothetical protein
MADEKAGHSVCRAVYRGVSLECGEGERMSDPTQRALSEASSMIGRREDRIQRALKVLQKAQRYDLAHYNTGAVMVHCAHGDYVDISDVQKAIQILQEGQT